ncbi:MAG: hypothetical protein COT91_05345 [Candidatus Doudnabacteria bacterium CG10_big_fil_rev_8_21_14_0_10_41_10]|uniref:DUF721 domain-containing protein n=1 Tax=Candidatus Doudnabacteria bacterium CG10_big_fil_rev_8_21_14_0_10_41_10 TaxID=1974551 RepID=A0A2H0VC26_9BACT|nr:MAG: hypothetical protein COT91_05345 [Candidatus Doudnabacteria bacterium CG10_big_fil_rev_8_21_14_0_10_41_10]
MESLKNLIRKKKQQRGLKKPLEIYELFAEWNKKASEVFGNKKINCYPKFLKGKTLYIQVEGGPLASELQLRQREFIKKINDHFEKKMVERIVFKL